MRNSFKNIVCLVLIFVAACSCGHRNSDGALLPEFEEYTFTSAEEGLYSVNIRYQHIANASKDGVLASIEEMNYHHTFDEYAVVPSSIEESVSTLVGDYAASCSSNSDMECIGCSYSLDQEAMLTRDDTILCFETCVEIYSGGAHGGDSLLYECYDLATGAIYDFSYLTDGEWASAVQALIYDRLSETCDGVLLLASADGVYIPRSVKITDSGLLLVYQPYEVASFDLGIISIELSDEELLAAGAPLVWVE